MRRRYAALTLPAAAIVTAGLATPSGAAADRTGPTGLFGITTLGLGAGSAYGEPSLAMAPDGTHYAVSTPGSSSSKGTVQVWHSADRGKSWGHTWFTSDEGGGDSELDFRPDRTLLGADLEFANGEQTDSEIHISKDFGKTWTDPGVQAGQEQDRQWF